MQITTILAFITAMGGLEAVKYPDQWQSCYMKWKQGEITAKEAMTQMQLKRTSFYKLVKEYEP